MAVAAGGSSEGVSGMEEAEDEKEGEESGHDRAIGELSGLPLPSSAEELLTWGPGWLAEALRAQGHMPAGAVGVNRIRRREQQEVSENEAPAAVELEKDDEVEELILEVEFDRGAGQIGMVGLPPPAGLFEEIPATDNEAPPHLRHGQGGQATSSSLLLARVLRWRGDEGHAGDNGSASWERRRQQRRELGRQAELMWRLAGVDLPLRMPTVLFGDSCRKAPGAGDQEASLSAPSAAAAGPSADDDLHRLVIITEWLSPEADSSRPHGGGLRYGFRHHSLRWATFEHCAAVVRAWGRLAGRTFAAGLASIASISAAAPAACYGGGGDSDETAIELERNGGFHWAKGNGDRISQKVAAAQEFLCVVAPHFFPPEVHTPSFATSFRSILYITMQNERDLNIWCWRRKDLRALTFCNLDDFLLHVADGELAVGLRDWRGVAVGPVIELLWRLLSCAPYPVLADDLDGFLCLFASSLSAEGGPEPDLPELRRLFFWAASLGMISLLPAIPEMYDLVPQEEWPSITSLGDERLLGRTASHGPLWRCLAQLVNFAALLVRFEFSITLEQEAPSVVSILRIERCGGHVLPVVVNDEWLEVRTGPAPSAALLCLVPPGLRMWIVINNVEEPMEGDTKQFVRLLFPISGWVLGDSAGWRLISQEEAGQLGMEPRQYATEFLIGLMGHIREKFVGHKSRGMCAVSAVELRKQIQTVPALRVVDRGRQHVVNGGFFVPHASSVDVCRAGGIDGLDGQWEPHSFLLLGDGSIADITADQFGCSGVPHLWWPADPRWYRFQPTPIVLAKVEAEEASLPYGLPRLVWSPFDAISPTVHGGEVAQATAAIAGSGFGSARSKVPGRRLQEDLCHMACT